MKKIILCSVFSIILLVLIINSSKDVRSIGEEANPIREGDSIVGMNYVITIGDDVKKNELDINTSIISSVLHYKDINSINDFFIDLKINNKSKYNYLIKNIVITDRYGVINKKVKYKKNKKKNYISINLNKDDLYQFTNNNSIRIELKK